MNSLLSGQLEEEEEQEVEEEVKEEQTEEGEINQEEERGKNDKLASLVFGPVCNNVSTLSRYG